MENIGDRMTEHELVVLDEVSGRLNAEAILSYLEAFGVAGMISMEAVSSVYTFSVGALSRVQILVTKEDEARAKELLAEFYTQAPVEDLIEFDTAELDEEITEEEE